nr:hypothetical protein [uncultured bacterium]
MMSRVKIIHGMSLITQRTNCMNQMPSLKKPAKIWAVVIGKDPNARSGFGCHKLNF